MQAIPLQSVQILFYALVFVILAAASITDIKTKHVPDWLTNSFVVCGVLYVALALISRPFQMPLSNLTGAFAVALPLFLFAFFKEGSIGGADIRLMFGLGLLVGVSSILRIFVFSTVLAIVVTVVVALIQKQKLSHNIVVPYIPFLLGGYILSTILSIQT